jgi:hypothetical protein
MARLITFILIALSAPSCRSGTSASRFGFARVTFASYYWSIADSIEAPIHSFVAKGISKPWRLVFERYVVIDSSGDCLLGCAHQIEGPLFFSRSGTPQAADSILHDVESWQLDSIFSPMFKRHEIYDGPYYFMVVKRKDGSRTMTRYDPRDLPPTVLRAHEFLRSAPEQKQLDSEPAIDLQALVDLIAELDAPQLAKIRFTRGEPVPIPDPNQPFRQKGKR